MVQYRYLGYGVTDEKGIAKLDHDPQGRAIEHSYTGSGAGKVDIVASLDSEIGDSSLVSETYGLYDCIYYDGATSNKNSNYFIMSTDGTSISYENNSYKITCGSNTARNYVDLRSNNPALNVNDLKGKKVKFEVNITGLNGKSIRLDAWDSSTSLGTTPYSSSDGNRSLEVTIPSNPTLLLFRVSPLNNEVWHQGDTYYFKDFMIYPI